MELPNWAPQPGEDGMWGLQEITKFAGVTLPTVNKWRAAPPPMGLPDPDVVTAGRRYPSPRWAAPRIVRWLAQTGRIDEHLRPVRPRHGGRRPGAHNTRRARNILLLQDAERRIGLVFVRLIAGSDRSGSPDRYVVRIGTSTRELVGDQVEPWLLGVTDGRRG